MKELLGNGLSFRVNGRLWIETENDRFLGPGRVELLERIIEVGSIAKAASDMEMSYKKAWDLISSMNAQALHPFVLTQAGGKKGGGAIVTQEGKKAIAAYRALQKRFQQFLEMETNLL